MSDCETIRDRFFGEPRLPRGNPELETHLASCEACRLAAQGLPAVSHALTAASRTAVQVPPFEAIAFAAAGAARAQRRNRAVRRSLPFLYTGLAAAAAAALVVVFVATRFSPDEPPMLEMGGRLETHSGAQLAVLASGAQVKLDAGAVKLVPAAAGEERLLLEVGLVSLEVPKLPKGRAVAVLTPDAEVRVHGTRFQVVRDGKGTSVSVAEGVVEVRPSGGGRQAIFVRAGESTIVEPPEAYRKGLRSLAQSALDRGEYAAAERHLAELLAADLDPAARAEAHALVAWALSASGRHHAAVERYRQALAALPPGVAPLWADNASAELALLLEREDPNAAVLAWREYLSRFPDGVHAALARTRAAAAKEP